MHGLFGEGEARVSFRVEVHLADHSSSLSTSSSVCVVFLEVRCISSTQLITNQTSYRCSMDVLSTFYRFQSMSIRSLPSFVTISWNSVVAGLQIDATRCTSMEIHANRPRIGKTVCVEEVPSVGPRAERCRIELDENPSLPVLVITSNH